MDQNESKMQIAVLIDSENVSSRYASIILMKSKPTALPLIAASTVTGQKITAGVKIFFWRIPSRRFSSLTIPRAKILPT